MSTKKKVNLYDGAPDGAVVELIWVDIWVRGSRQTPPLFLPITLLSSRLSLRFDIDWFMGKPLPTREATQHPKSLLVERWPLKGTLKHCLVCLFWNGKSGRKLFWMNWISVDGCWLGEMKKRLWFPFNWFLHSSSAPSSLYLRSNTNTFYWLILLYFCPLHIIHLGRDIQALIRRKAWLGWHINIPSAD